MAHKLPATCTENLEGKKKYEVENPSTYFAAYTGDEQF